MTQWLRINRMTSGTPLVRAVLSVAILFAVPSVAQQQDQQWSAEVPVHESELYPVLGGEPDLACNGDVCLGVWLMGNRVVGARFDASGAPLDPVPFNIHHDPESWSTREPRVLWNGERFLVLWRENYEQIQGRFVDRDGNLADETNVLATQTFIHDFDAATDGRVVIFVTGSWTATVVDRNGSIHTLATSDLRHIWLTEVASNGDDFVFAGSIISPAGNQGFVTRWNGDGPDLAPLVAVDTGGSFRGILAPAGEDYLMLDYGACCAVEARRIRADLTVGSPFDVVEHRTSVLHAVPRPTGEVLVVSGDVDDHELRVSVISSNDEVTTHQLGTKAWLFAVSPLAEDRLAILGRTELEGMRHVIVDSRTFELLSNEITSGSRAEQKHPTAVGTTLGWFTTWRENVGTSFRVMGRIMLPSLAALPAFPISTAGQLSYLSPPVLAKSEESVLVTWVEGDSATYESRLMGRRFTAGGESLDPEPLFIAAVSGITGALADAPRHASVWNGRYFIVAWTSPERPFELRISRVTRDGLVLDQDGKRVVGSERETYQILPSLAVSGDTTLLVWQDGEVPSECNITCFFEPVARIEGMTLDTEGNPTRAIPLLFARADFTAAAPRVAATQGTFLVSWIGFEGVVGRLVLESGSWWGESFSIGPSYWGLADLTGTPSGFIAVWDGADGVYARRIGIRGEQSEPQTIAAGDRTKFAWQNGMTPGVASRGNDLLILYARMSEQDGFVSQAFMRGLYTPQVRRRGVVRP